jgi:hypothetical protein
MCPATGYDADADYETLAQLKLLVPSAFRGYVPARHPALRVAKLTRRRRRLDCCACAPGGGGASRQRVDRRLLLEPTSRVGHCRTQAALALSARRPAWERRARVETMDRSSRMLRGQRPSTTRRCRCRRRSGRHLRVRPVTSQARMCSARQTKASAEQMDWSAFRLRWVQHASCRKHRIETASALRMVQYAAEFRERSAVAAAHQEPGPDPLHRAWACQGQAAA